MIEKDDQGKPDLGKGLLAAAYGDEVAEDPERLAEVERRRDLLFRLMGKYGATIDAVLREPLLVPSDVPTVASPSPARASPRGRASRSTGLPKSCTMPPITMPQPGVPNTPTFANFGLLAAHSMSPFPTASAVESPTTAMRIGREGVARVVDVGSVEVVETATTVAVANDDLRLGPGLAGAFHLHGSQQHTAVAQGQPAAFLGGSPQAAVRIHGGEHASIPRPLADRHEIEAAAVAAHRRADVRGGLRRHQFHAAGSGHGWWSQHRGGQAKGRPCGAGRRAAYPRVA